MFAEKSTIIATSKEHLSDEIHRLIQNEGHGCDLNCIDVSEVTDMSYLFSHTVFNGTL